MKESNEEYILVESDQNEITKTSSISIGVGKMPMPLKYMLHIRKAEGLPDLDIEDVNTIKELYDTGDQANMLIANHLIVGLFGLKKGKEG